MLQAVLYYSTGKSAPTATVRFPIENYNETYNNFIGIGTNEGDFFIRDIDGDYPILKRLEGKIINVDELDYLVKRLEGMDRYEIAKFQGAAVSQSIFGLKDLINLTFCCQMATVVQDFSDLNAIGRQYYQDLYGSTTEDELNAIDARGIAISLLTRGTGKVTPYGVIYENGMVLEEVYDGVHFPDYDYECDTVMTIAATCYGDDPEASPISWLYLPMADCKIERILKRAGIHTPDNAQLDITENNLPRALDRLLLEGEPTLQDLNQVSAEFKRLNEHDRVKFEAAALMALPSDLTEAVNLIKQLELFDFVPDVSTPREYGRYMIKDSAHYEYDSELDEFYDYEKYANTRIAHENGQFTRLGYISYNGVVPIGELLSGGQNEGMSQAMGGI